jgi:hypothetical protein
VVQLPEQFVGSWSRLVSVLLFEVVVE